MKHMIKVSLALIICMGAALTVSAQKKDTTRSVDITSSFRPILKAPAKLAFNATPPSADTSKPRLQYDIPNPNLLFAYQPGSLKPLALAIDTNVAFANSNYIKAGFGSLRTPYVQAGFSFGDGNTAGVNIYARHVSSQGKKEFQDFTNTQVKLSGFYKTAGNVELNASLGMKQERTYKYGYLPETLSFPKDSIRQRFQTISARLAARNLESTEFGLNYAPEIRIDIFGDHIKNNESNTVVNLPLEKTVGKDFAVNLGVTFDLTRLSPDNKSAVNNTMWYLSPSVVYKSTTLRLQGGIRPSWDNKTFKMFPNILAEVGTDDQRFTFQAGWTGYVRKTSFLYLASQNPWLWVPGELRNTWIEERYAGFKGTVGDHFTYSAKVGFNKLSNQPLFINDTTAAGDGKSFAVVYADKMNVLNLGGELGYTVAEKFSVISSLSFNQFTGLRGQHKAWGMLPLEFNTALRLQVIRDLWLKTDLFAWSGPRYMRQDGSDGKLSGAFDLNAGLEFKITRNINLWTQFNNIFNKEYQRWNQYRVYGFNFVGGIIFSFDQKP
ncbi:MAG: TonB-dependent receptor [Chitinophagaceae bacterium]|nr:TonB-dependent receptor [Chitinophagaceae bacterium]